MEQEQFLKSIETLKQIIKSQIKKYGQRKFAKEFGIDETQVCNFIKDRRNFSYKRLMLINLFFQNK